VALRAVLEDARTIGLLGPGPPEDHVTHAEDLARIIGTPPQRFLDLGSGGGVPGLVLAALWPTTTAALLDRRRKSAEFLKAAIDRLALTARIEVIEAEAESAARTPEQREAFALVVARSFAAPAVTAECASGFLQVGGALVVTEPPGGEPSRWPTDELALLGLSPATVRRSGTATAAILQKTAPTDDRWPRRSGVPAKRPLW